MQIKTIFLITLLAVFLFLQACKPDYSDSTPKWIKTQIINCKKEVRDNGGKSWNITANNCKDEIAEYTETTYGTVYGMLNKCDDFGNMKIDYYDAKGIFICEGGSTNCLTYSITNNNYPYECVGSFDPVYKKTIFKRHF